MYWKRTETDLQTFQASMMEHFYENTWQLSGVNYRRKKPVGDVWQGS